MFNIIVAVDNNFGLAKTDSASFLEWDIKEDLAYFRQMTNKADSNAIIMGRKTADTLKKPLPNRLNVVISSQTDYMKCKGFFQFPEFNQALAHLVHNKIKNVFVIGGAQLLDEALKYSYLLKHIYLTVIEYDYKCDVKSTQFEAFCQKCSKEELESQNCLDHRNNRIVLVRYLKLTHLIHTTHSEYQYLEILRSLLSADSRLTRNGLVRSRFSTQMTFDLQEGFPLLTTKRVYWNGIVNELLFFLSGNTDNKWLQDRGVHIWDKNTTKEFIISCGLAWEEGTLGPMYGHQFRYFGAEYKGKNVDYTGQGIDQFKEVIDLLLNDPMSRRILMSSYNCAQVKQGILYPCHGLVIQFYVEETKNGGDLVRLVSLQMTQRSCDIGCGAPFNIASYALLLHIVVNVLNQKSQVQYLAHKIHLILGDYHLYNNHLSQAILQLSRIPKKFPKLIIQNDVESIEPKYFLSIKADNFKMVDYDCHPAIKMEMVA